MNFRNIVMLAVMAQFLFSSNVSAVPITFLFSGKGDGYVDDFRTGFEDKPFTIRVFADTADVEISPSPPGMTVLAVEDIYSEISLEGFPTGRFTLENRVFVNQTLSGLGFSSTTFHMDLLNVRHPEFSTYDLRGPFTPIFAAQPSVGAFAQPTTIGRVQVVQIFDVTFSALVPEPNMIHGIWLILGCLLGSRRFRQDGADIMCTRMMPADC